MSLSDEQRRSLARLIGLTRDEELDCDAFARQLAAYVDDGLRSKVKELMAAHADLCAECDEELELLRSALERD